MRASRAAASISVRRRAAFTTTELVLVLVITGIIGAVAAPRMFVVSSFTSRFFEDELLANLRHAQKLAVASGCEVQLDFTASSYVLTQRAACKTGSFTSAIIDPATNSSGFSRSAPSGVTVASTVDPLIFDALGRATNAAGTATTATVTVGARSFAVEAESGFAHGL